MRGLRREPLAPWKCFRAFRLACGLAAQPAQNLGGLNDLGTLDVPKAATDVYLELRFK